MNLQEYFMKYYVPQNIIVCEDIKVVFEKVENGLRVKRTLELINDKEYTLEEFISKYGYKSKLKKIEYTYNEGGKNAIAVVLM